MSSKASKFSKVLEEMQALHTKKNHDYSSRGEFDNFELVSEMSGLSVDDVFLVQICNKVARIKALRSQGKTPNFESIADTRRDLAIYSTMWDAYHLEE